MRKLNRGVEFRRIRVFWTKKNWKTKPHPFWYVKKYRDGVWTFQSIRLEIWKRVGSSRVDLQACKLEYSIVSPK